MPVKFTVISRPNPLKPSEPKKFYANMKNDGEITLKQLSKRIGTMSTVNSADVLAVLDTLLQVMQDELSQGRIVRFGEFGSFAVSLSSMGKEKEEEVNATAVKAAKLLFKPGKDLKNMLAVLEFQKA
jgi:predicted histone-like DNA-binding protein